jgi:hypothetical protein
MKSDIKKLGWDIADLQLKLSLTVITNSFFRQEIRKLAEQYAKLKVIEELENQLQKYYKQPVEIYFSDRVIDRIKELKQER